MLCIHQIQFFCNEGNASLVRPLIFLVCSVFPLYLKVRHTAITSPSLFNSLNTNSRCLQYPFLWKYLHMHVDRFASAWYVAWLSLFTKCIYDPKHSIKYESLLMVFAFTHAILSGIRFIWKTFRADMISLDKSTSNLSCIMSYNAGWKLILNLNPTRYQIFRNISSL
jgi:hypothetical protein